MILELYVQVKGAAFVPPDGDRDTEVGRIVREAATMIEDGRTSGKLLDINGNIVGVYRLAEEPAPHD